MAFAWKRWRGEQSARGPAKRPTTFDSSGGLSTHHDAWARDETEHAPARGWLNEGVPRVGCWDSPAALTSCSHQLLKWSTTAPHFGSREANWFCRQRPREAGTSDKVDGSPNGGATALRDARLVITRQPTHSTTSSFSLVTRPFGGAGQSVVPRELTPKSTVAAFHTLWTSCEDTSAPRPKAAGRPPITTQSMSRVFWYAQSPFPQSRSPVAQHPHPWHRAPSPRSAQHPNSEAG